MPFQLDLCYFCLKYLIDNDEFKWLCKKNENQYHITYIEKINKNFIFSKTVPQKGISEYKLCLDCCKTIDEMYKFSENCVKSIKNFNQYKKKLCSTNFEKQEKIKILLPNLSEVIIEEMRSQIKNTNNEDIEDIKLEVKEEIIEEEIDYHFEEIEKHEDPLNDEFLIQENCEVKLEKDDSRDCLNVCSGTAQNLENLNDFANLHHKNEMAVSPSSQNLIDFSHVKNNQTDIAMQNPILIYPTSDQFQFVEEEQKIVAVNTHSDTILIDQFPSSCQTSQNDINNPDNNLDGFRRILPKSSDNRGVSLSNTKEANAIRSDNVLVYINNPNPISSGLRKILPKKVSLSNKKGATTIKSDNVCQKFAPDVSVSKTKEVNSVESDSDSNMFQTLDPEMSVSKLTFQEVEKKKSRRKDVVTIRGGTYEFKSLVSVPNKNCQAVNVINEPVSVKNDSQMNPSQNLVLPRAIGNPDMSVSNKKGTITVRNDIQMKLSQSVGFSTTIESVTGKNDSQLKPNQSLAFPTAIDNPDMSMSNTKGTVTLRNDIQIKPSQSQVFLTTIKTENDETGTGRNGSQLNSSESLVFPTAIANPDMSVSNTKGTITVRNDIQMTPSQSQTIETVTIKSEFGDEHDSFESRDSNSGTEDLKSDGQNDRKYPLIDLNRWKIYDKEKDIDTLNCVQERNYECDLCPSKFFTSKNLSNHKSKVHSEKKFQCEICTFAGTTLYSLKSHLKTHENGNFECAICNKVFKTESSLKMHNIVHEEDKKFVCDLCGKSLAYRKSYNHHMKLHYGTIEKKFSCKICDARFAQQNMLSKHLSIHSGEKNEKCDLCEKTFRLKNTLKKHKKTCHNEERIFLCTVCDASFAQQNKLSKHLSIHTDEKNEKCDLCPKTFRQKYTLKLHKKTVHSEEKMFSCEFCDKKFKYINSIKAHTLAHTQEKNYNCHLCEKKFAQKSNLRLHILSHFKELNFECDICHKKFTSDFYMKRHRKFHFKKPYSCKICQQSFTAKHSLAQHARKHELVTLNEKDEQPENMSIL